MGGDVGVSPLDKRLARSPQTLFTLAWTDSDSFPTLAVDLEFLPRATLDLNASGRGRLVCVCPYTHAFACPGAKRVGNITLGMKLAVVAA
jgi:hypothetical protein